jgi:two-component system cell cycle sensor histidine kinase/response regulator CckA
VTVRTAALVVEIGIADANGDPSCKQNLELTQPMSDSPILSTPLAGAQTVLVVDDVRIVRHVIYRLLSQVGYRVFEAASGAEALEVLTTATRPIDLVIVDVVMPKMSGVGLARRIHEQWPGMRILFMSAYPAEILVREGLEHPNVVFLAKPFSGGELLNKVTAALQREPTTSPVRPTAEKSE